MRSLHTRHYKTYVAVLVEARQRANLSQQAVADRLRKPQSFVSKYERGERRLDIPEFLAIARAIGYKSTLLLRRVEAAIYGNESPSR